MTDRPLQLSGPIMSLHVGIGAPISHLQLPVHSEAISIEAQLTSFSVQLAASVDSTHVHAPLQRSLASIDAQVMVSRYVASAPLSTEIEDPVGSDTEPCNTLMVSSNGAGVAEYLVNALC